MTEMIDAHHHLWHYSAEEYGWIGSEMQVLQRDFLARDLERAMRAAAVDGSVAVQARQSIVESEWLLSVAEEASSILGVVGWAPLTDPDLPRILDSLRSSHKLKGLRHVIQDEPDDDFILRDDFNRGIDLLADTGLVYDLLIQERHLPQAATFVRRHPEQIFVLDHLAKPKIRERILQPWRGHLRGLAEHENVYCKLSGLVTEADWDKWTLDDLRPYLDTALEVFGAERLMAGSDWPVCLLASGYERWWSTLRAWAADLSESERAQIFSETASRVYRIRCVSE